MNILLRISVRAHQRNDPRIDKTIVCFCRPDNGRVERGPFQTCRRCGRTCAPRPAETGCGARRRQVGMRWGGRSSRHSLLLSPSQDLNRMTRRDPFRPPRWTPACLFILCWRTPQSSARCAELVRFYRGRKPGSGVSVWPQWCLWRSLDAGSYESRIVTRASSTNASFPQVRGCRSQRSRHASVNNKQKPLDVTARPAAGPVPDRVVVKGSHYPGMTDI